MMDYISPCSLVVSCRILYASNVFESLLCYNTTNYSAASSFFEFSFLGISSIIKTLLPSSLVAKGFRSIALWSQPSSCLHEVSIIYNCNIKEVDNLHTLINIHYRNAWFCKKSRLWSSRQLKISRVCGSLYPFNFICLRLNRFHLKLLRQIYSGYSTLFLACVLAASIDKLILA